MSNMEGKKVPQVTFRARQGDQWVDVTLSLIHILKHPMQN